MGVWYLYWLPDDGTYVTYFVRVIELRSESCADRLTQVSGGVGGRYVV